MLAVARLKSRFLPWNPSLVSDSISRVDDNGKFVRVPMIVDFKRKQGGRMTSHLVCLWNDESGAILSAELVLLTTILVLGMIVGLSEVQSAVVFELNDLSNGIGAINQSYGFRGFCGAGWMGTRKSFVAGSTFSDLADLCDRNESADFQCAVSSEL